jgi:hypothetical protein
MPTSAIPLRRRVARWVFFTSGSVLILCLVLSAVFGEKKPVVIAAMICGPVAYGMMAFNMGKLRDLDSPHERRCGLDRRRGGSLPQPHRADRRRSP